jgi:methylthioribose-1-phosphate isomerase
MINSSPAIRWQGGRLELLDQRQLPHSFSYIALTTAEQVAGAIRDMVIRGAPAIGITAAYGAALAARACPPGSISADAWLRALEPALTLLAASRPTAVNLFWALAQVRAEIQRGDGDDDVPARLEALAISLHRRDIADNRRLGDFGAALLSGDMTIYTHCNAGALATGGYGTALGVIQSAYREGKVRQVYAGETRPWLQGARLTALELVEAGIPVKISTEGAAGSLMRRGLVDWVIVGADRVAANGDVVNKIGTYNLAVLARHHGVKFMVALPSSTIDPEVPDGDAIPIEQRASEEVTHFGRSPIAPVGVVAINPSFDVTPANLVDAMVTELGVVERPNRARISALLA